jgi:hypothetical protein
MTETTIKTEPRVRRSNRISFLAGLVSRRESGGRIIERHVASFDPEYREVLEAIHRPSK